LYLAEIPLSLHKLNIINTMHLQELERLFDEICSKEIDNQSLFDSALEVCPDLVLHHSDEYMATLINNLSIE
jgi:hypothetical protein